MILDHDEEVTAILRDIQHKKTLLVPIFCNSQHHVSTSNLTAIYIYSENDIEVIIPIHHTEQIRGFREYIQDFLQLKDIFVHDKKKWLQIGGNEDVWDVKTLWWYTYGESYEESHYPTPAHEFYWRRHSNLTQVNGIVPMQQHLSMCQKIRKYAWPMIINVKLSDSYKHFNSIYPKVFANIEENGLHVTNSFKLPELINNDYVYSQYHYHTSTGRPSNAYRGFNFAAMNKEDGTRDAFCSRFKDGALVEMDFDAYHVRLIARLIGYKLPQGSIHEYFGKFYFDVDILTKEQYEQSKQITFRLLYGNIDKEFLSIPFFKQVNSMIFDLWNKWKHQHYIETPILKRRLSNEYLKNMTANKLFNYYLQAIETEVSVQKLDKVQDILIRRTTCMILYTYDSILFDIPLSEAKYVLPDIKNVLESGGFPVKCKVGNIYSKMKTISL